MSDSILGLAAALIYVKQFRQSLTATILDPDESGAGDENEGMPHSILGVS